ncbi:conjugal transfer protein TraB (plasmid) [Legionella israelensis]|uniref:TrbI/VirB10 family protein n=1 Tax=Legionella israelensis TaxID=454 RepID=UPI00117CA7F6|nr:TrbI/VirB10 family protein [Legionella israelensis]QDP73718.1 conjugal transfer protein TraB [Legionella israelensis]
MAKFNLNIKHRAHQYKNMASMAAIVVIVLASLITLFSGSAETEQKDTKKDEHVFNGIVDDTFSDADAASAMTAQQMELTDLKKELSDLKETLKKSKEKEQSNTFEPEKMEAALLERLTKEMNKAKVKGNGTGEMMLASKGDLSGLGFNEKPIKPAQTHRLNKTAAIHTVSFNYDPPKSHVFSKNASNYVPSGTFVKAVVLGGADADASVNGAKKNNGVMLFKLITQGTLPNNQQSRLKGCFITASTYGDISSERAYVTLDKISCAQKGRPILDKTVTGWAFFAGKVGIKGRPLMRDGKVVQWAGISGALSGIASAAQYAQSVQSIGPFGATSVVPSDRIGAYAGLGGASKAADQLSSYYIKRAEQYHPVIQVGAGNLVNIVFKDGFSLLSDEDEAPIRRSGDTHDKSSYSTNEAGIPESILREINKSGEDYGAGSQLSTQG